MSARLVIAGTHSGVGKTTLTAGVITVLRRHGLTVQPFKVGPDYIDPTYHGLAAGRPCRNLDTWLLPPERARSLFVRVAAGADVAIIEGVMGLYDGADYDGEAGSTAEVAKLLGAPVVLVVDASKMARSAGAVALGYQRFDDGVPLAGFVVNRVAGEGHGRGVASSITKATGLPVLGWVPREESLHVPERHLGLIPTREPGGWEKFLRAAGDAVSRHLDVGRLLTIARQAAPLPEAAEAVVHPAGNSPVIAVARDKAFHFTYEDNLDLLREAGAEIALFSPLRDAALPPGTAGVVLSGGFPEVFAGALGSNRAMHAALRTAHRRGLPMYAECGGLMYLTRAIIDGEGRRHEMVGLLPGHSVMSGRLTMGYRLARAVADSWLLPGGETVRGHEFHYSTWEDRPADLPPAWLLLPRTGEGDPRPEGACVGSVWASYVHLHFAARPGLAERFVAAACSVAASCQLAGSGEAGKLAACRYERGGGA
jgi:cobyrinic acid a,c-diamide synthase